MNPNTTRLFSQVLIGWVFACAIAHAASNEGYRLDGRSAVYQVRHKSLDLTDAVTLEAWIRADKMAEKGGRILDKSAPGTQRGYMLDT